MRNLFALILPLCATPFAMQAAVPAYAQNVTAGTVIRSVAEASYSGPNGTLSVTSNTSEVRVNELLAVAVTWVDSRAPPTNADTAIRTFEVTNVGNGNEAYGLEIETALASNDFDLILLNISIDSNSNGVFDPGIDAVLSAPAQTPALAPGEVATIFIGLALPASRPPSGNSQIEIRANAASGTGAPGTVLAGLGDGGVDAIAGGGSAAAIVAASVIADQPNVELIKSARVLDPFGGNSAIPGATITYTLMTEISGAGSINGLIVSDNIPAGSEYIFGTLTLNGAPLTDQSGDDSGEADAAQINVAFPAVATGTNHTITFQVAIQ